jgi:hypothetical protein
MREVGRGFGCAFEVIWLLAVGSIIAAAFENDPETKVPAAGAFLGRVGLAPLWGIAYVLRTGEFFWTRRYARRILDGGIVTRHERPVAFCLFVLLLAVLAAATLAVAAWRMLHPHWPASRPRSSGF